MIYKLQVPRFSWRIARVSGGERMISLAVRSEVPVAARCAFSVTCRPSEPMLVVRATVADAPSWGPFCVVSAGIVLGEDVGADDLRDRRAGSWVRPAVDPRGTLTLRSENVTGEARVFLGCWWGCPFSLERTSGPYTRDEALGRYRYLRARGEEVFLHSQRDGWEEDRG